AGRRSEVKQRWNADDSALLEVSRIDSSKRHRQLKMTVYLSVFCCSILKLAVEIKKVIVPNMADSSPAIDLIGFFVRHTRTSQTIWAFIWEFSFSFRASGWRSQPIVPAKAGSAPDSRLHAVPTAPGTGIATSPGSTLVPPPPPQPPSPPQA